MMKKYLFISFIISIFLTSNALANCNFQIIDFEKSKEHLKKKLKYDESMELMIIPDEFGGELVLAPLFETCNKESALGTMAEYLFINDKLKRIHLTRANMPDRNLMITANSKYGKIPLPTGMPLDQWRGNYYWEKGNVIIEFHVVNLELGGHMEIINIESLKNRSVMDKYYEKVGKWLDTQN